MLSIPMPNQIFTHIFFKKYKILKEIDSGSYGDVYEAEHINDKTHVAVKLEKRFQKQTYLKSEYSFMYDLQGFGIPKLITFGINTQYNILVMELLGASLKKILSIKGGTFNLKDVCIIGIQLMNRFKFIHSKYIVHRDIKPANFLIGKDNPHIIYVIDFGFAKKYRSSSTGRHIKFSLPRLVEGTDRYLSTNATRGVEQSRRDDLESIAFMLVYFLKGSLPWQKYEKYDDVEYRYYQIYKSKKLTTPKKLCQNLPEEFEKMVAYCQNLGFEEDPDYDYLKGLLQNVLVRNYSINDLELSWNKVINGADKKHQTNKNMMMLNTDIIKYIKVKN